MNVLEFFSNIYEEALWYVNRNKNIIKIYKMIKSGTYILSRGIEIRNRVN